MVGRGLATLDLATEYRTGEADLVQQFLRPCLSQARTYDRAVGYFRSTVFVVAGESVLEFARRGGRMRMICCPQLAGEDVTALTDGYARRSQIASGLIEQEVMALVSEPSLKRHAEILATLIALQILDLKIAVRPASTGIYHEKLGLFDDAFANVVTFRGSSNETWQGWHLQGNLEAFEVFCSWRGGVEQARTERHRAYFQRLWQNEVRELEVVPFPDAARRQLYTIARDTVGELVPPEVVKDTVAKPRPHQELALEEWRKRGRRGILAHATGSGKTFTALLAIREHADQGGVTLVLVPSELLLKQWADEIGKHIANASILRVGAGNNLWREPGRVESFVRQVPGMPPRVILATMQTASKEEFRKRLGSGEHLLVVADEVHQLGSFQNAKLLTIDAGARLGLSATPDRYGDPGGTSRILEYFAGVVDPPFTLRDAIDAGVLVPYEYFPHKVTLAANESLEWREISAQIRREVAKLHTPDGATIKLTERIKLLLIERARIAKQAKAKVPLASAVLREHFVAGQRWLVYCDDLNQLKDVLEQLRAAGFEANEYHSQMGVSEAPHWPGFVGTAAYWFPLGA